MNDFTMEEKPIPWQNGRKRSVHWGETQEPRGAGESEPGKRSQSGGPQEGEVQGPGSVVEGSWLL